MATTTGTVKEQYRIRWAKQQLCTWFAHSFLSFFLSFFFLHFLGTWEEKTRKATNPVSQIHSTPFGRHRQHDWPGQAVWIGTWSLWLEEAPSSRPMMMMMTFLDLRCTTATWKFLTYRFTEGVIKTKRFFLNLDLDVKSSKIDNIWQIEHSGIIAIMFERGQVYFLRDVFAIVADVAAKAPITVWKNLMNSVHYLHST